MILIKPGMHLCLNKTTKYPISGHDPVNWIWRDDKDYITSTVDGYIIDVSHKVTGIFKRYEYEGTPLDIDQVEISHFNEVLSVSELMLLHKFANIFQSPLLLFIWPKNYPENNKIDKNKKCIFIFRINDDKGELKIVKRWFTSILKLEALIYKLRKRNFNIVKGLNSAKTNLECYLANNTSNPWPGDLDCMIYQKSSERFISFVEFKTHNQPTSVKLENIGKYGNQDWRRFQVLFDLQNYFYEKHSYKPNLYYVVWGSQNIVEHEELKIDKISNNSVLKTTIITRPPFGKYSQQVFENIL